MSTERILIRGNTASRLAVTPAQGQIGSDDTLKQVILGDGTTPGGIPMAREDQKNIGSLGYTAVVKADNYTVVAADIGKIIVANKATAIEFLLTAPATLGNKFVTIIKNEGVGALTVNPDAAEIDGATSLVLAQGQAVVISCDGSNFRTALMQTGGGSGSVQGLPTDGTTDALAILVAAQAAGDVIRVPTGTYFLSDKIDILDNKDWIFDNVTLTHDDDTKHFFSAVGKSGFSLRGNLRIIGMRTTTETGAETALILEDCEDYSIENIVAEGLAGKGFDVRGTTGGSFYGDKARASGLLALRCAIGFEMQAGAGAEYGTWSNCSAVDNGTGVKMAAGNHIWQGGTITNNDIGVDLLAGANHLHGSFVGTLINHNTTSVRGTDVQLGHTFADCRFYDGTFEFDGCANIVFEGGVMDDVAFTNDLGAAGGFNFVRNVNFPGSVQVNSVSGDAPGNLQFVRNFGGGIGRALNSPSEHYVAVYKAGLTALPDGVEDNVVFTTSLHNRNGDYDTSSGVWTAPEDGIWRITFSALFNATTITATASYADLQVDAGSGFASNLLVLPTIFGSDKIRLSESCDLGLNAGNQMRLQINISSVGAPSFGDALWLSVLSIEKIG